MTLNSPFQHSITYHNHTGTIAITNHSHTVTITMTYRTITFILSVCVSGVPVTSPARSSSRLVVHCCGSGGIPVAPPFPQSSVFYRGFSAIIPPYRAAGGAPVPPSPPLCSYPKSPVNPKEIRRGGLFRLLESWVFHPPKPPQGGGVNSSEMPTALGRFGTSILRSAIQKRSIAYHQSTDAQKTRPRTAYLCLYAHLQKRFDFLGGLR